MQRLTLAACAAIAMLLSSCSTHAVQWTLEPTRHGELPDVVGDPSVIREAPFELPIAFNEGLADKTEYGEKTGKWLRTGFGISAGKHAPGDVVFAQLDAVPEGVRVRFQLTERDASLGRVALLKETIASEHAFRAKLPVKEGALYLLSAEVLDGNGQVEDTLLSLVEVPMQAMNARLTTDRSAYERGMPIELALENAGPTELFHGLEYVLERREREGWRRLNFTNTAFPAIGYMLKPGETYTQTIKLPNLPSGAYRVIKSFRAEGTNLEATLAAEFSVTRTFGFGP